jgi:hypothetical protein
MYKLAKLLEHEVCIWTSKRNNIERYCELWEISFVTKRDRFWILNQTNEINCDLDLMKQKVYIADEHTRVYPKVSGLNAWNENCK